MVYEYITTAATRITPLLVLFAMSCQVRALLGHAKVRGLVLDWRDSTGDAPYRVLAERGLRVTSNVNTKYVLDSMLFYPTVVTFVCVHLIRCGTHGVERYGRY